MTETETVSTSIEAQAWRSEDTGANSFTDVSGAWLGAAVVHNRSLHQISWPATPGHGPIVFALEGLRRARIHTCLARL
jgi:hypothetical protein